MGHMTLYSAVHTQPHATLRIFVATHATYVAAPRGREPENDT